MAGHAKAPEEYYRESDNDAFGYHVKDEYYLISEDLAEC